MKRRSIPSEQPRNSRSRALLWLCGLLLLGLAGVMVVLSGRDGVSSATKSSKPEQPVIKQITGGEKARPEAPSTEAHPDQPAQIGEMEQKICDIIGSGRSYDQMSKELLALLPQCEGPTQQLAMSHLSDLIGPDQARQLVPLLAEPKINPSIREQIFSTMFEGEPFDVAALMIEVIGLGDTAFASEAQKTLGILLAADHGRDVAAWRTELQSQRAAQAAE